MFAIYIGSFNPITKAHLSIAQASLTFADKCIFVPVSDLYAKPSLQVKAEDRLNMIKCAIQDEPRFEVNDIEIKVAEATKHQNKSLETLRMLKAEYQEDLAFMIGADNLLQIKTWYHYQELLKEFQVIVISRDCNLVSKIIEKDAELKELLSLAILLDDINIDISSEKVRTAVANQQSIDEYVTPIVKKYIEVHELYGGK